MSKPISDNILQTINIGIKKAIESTTMDKTYTGTVTQVLGDKHYIVNYNNANRTVKTKNTLLLKVGDVVHITHPYENPNVKIMWEDVPSSNGTITTGVTSVDGLTGVVSLENRYASKSSEHPHLNKTTLDLLSTSTDGQLLFDGQQICSTSDNTPIGTVIMYIGNNTPNGYLLCDNRDLLITDYNELAEHIYTQFGSYNYFDDDESCTDGYFTLPDVSIYNNLLKCLIKY